MKLFKISVLLNVAVSLNCYECRGKTYLDCEQSKELVTCEENEEVCQLSIRKRDGVIEKIKMGCKQHVACDNNMSRNFDDDDTTTYDQCRPAEADGTSHCRQCCDRADNCSLSLAALNAGEGPLTQAEWVEDLADHELPVVEEGEGAAPVFLLPTQETDKEHWNDSRYDGSLTEYIGSSNDARYDPDDPRHLDDYYNPNA